MKPVLVGPDKTLGPATAYRFSSQDERTASLVFGNRPISFRVQRYKGWNGADSIELNVRFHRISITIHRWGVAKWER